MTTKESFIESLTHDSYVIQIPNLKQKRRNDLEKLLSIFDQSTSVDPERHILNIKEENFPRQHRSLIRLLQSEVLEPALRKKMAIEDSVLLNIEDIQRDLIEKIAAAEHEANEAKQEATESKRKVALKLKIKGMTIEEIIDIRGLSLKEVEII